MKLAYIILAYRDVEQVSKLINTLRDVDVSFVVHVCKNTENSYVENLRKLQFNKKDVFFCKREVGIHFYFGLVRGALNALEFLVINKIDFDYVSLISGQDYPIKTNQQFKRFLSENNGKEFMSFWPLHTINTISNQPNHPWGHERQIYRLDRYNIKFCGKINSIPEIESGRLIDHNLYKTLKIFLHEIPNYFNNNRLKQEFLLLFFSRILPKKRKLPDFDIYGGSTWWTISKKFVQYIYEINNKNSKYNKYFKYTLIPDEMYFQTILFNSPFKNNVVNDNLREIVWDPNDKTHPLVFKEEHFDYLSKSEKFFARKFVFGISEKVVELLDNKNK